MTRLLHQIANVKFQALDPGVEMHRAPLQKSCQASDMPRWAEHMPKLGTLLGCDMPSRAKDKSQLHEPVEMENSEKETSKLPHSPEMRISAGSDSFPAEFLRGRGGGKQARIVSWHLTNSRSRFQHCLNRRERSVF